MTANSFRSALDITTSIAVVVLSATAVWTVFGNRGTRSVTLTHGSASAAAQPLPTGSYPVEGMPVLGRPAAPITVIEFADFECPFCRTFVAETLPAVTAKYVDSGLVRIVFGNFPIGSHRFALKAAEAAECASEQGKFWQMHSSLFEDQEHLGLADLRARAQRLGLDRDRFEACLQSSRSAGLTRDVVGARRLGVSSTPTFLFGLTQPDGGVKLLQRAAGALRLSNFGERVDSLLATIKAQSGSPANPPVSR